MGPLHLQNKTDWKQVRNGKVGYWLPQTDSLQKSFVQVSG